MDRLLEWVTDLGHPVDCVEASFASILVGVNGTSSLNLLPIRSQWVSPAGCLQLNLAANPPQRSVPCHLSGRYQYRLDEHLKTCRPVLF